MEDGHSMEPVQFDGMKLMLQDLYKLLEKLVLAKSTDLQDTMKAESISTRGVLVSVQQDMVAIKSTLESQAEYLEGFLKKAAGQENEPIGEGWKNISDDEESQSKKIAGLEAINTGLESKMSQMVCLADHRQILEKLSIAENRLNESETRQRNLRVQVGRLQTHITKHATNANELIDSEIKGKIEYIRARTQTIVAKYCVGPGTKPRRDLVEFKEIDLDWARKKRQLLYQEDLDAFSLFWVRSKIYAILEADLFSQAVFGLEEDLDSKLAEFEKLIRKGNPDSDVGDWRALTIQYGKGLGMKNKNFSEVTATYLEKLFHPWIPEMCVQPPVKPPRPGSKPTSTRDRFPSQLHLDLVDICQVAYSLAVMLRQSREKYTFEHVAEGSIIETDEDSNFEILDMNGPASKRIGSKVWVCLFGALVKESLDGERHVLVKAQVIGRVLKEVEEHPMPPKTLDPR